MVSLRTLGESVDWGNLGACFGEGDGTRYGAGGAGVEGRARKLYLDCLFDSAMVEHPVSPFCSEEGSTVMAGDCGGRGAYP